VRTKYVCNETFLFEGEKELANGLSAEKVLEEVRFSLGKDLWNLLNREDWTDIDINPDGSVWIDNGKSTRVECSFTESGLQSAAMMLASYSSNKFNSESAQSLVAVIPVLDIRCSFIGPPAVSRTIAAFRRPSKELLDPYSLVASGTITQGQFEYLKDAVDSYRNILISGGTGSGKTTIMNSLMTLIDPEDRLYVVQDVDELRFSQDNLVKIKVNDKFEYDKAIAEALRFNPTRVIVGECRFPAQAQSMLEAWNTGHPGGMATIHADNAKAVLERVDSLQSKASASGVSQMDVIKETIQVIVQMKRIHNTRKLVELYDVREDKYIG